MGADEPDDNLQKHPWPDLLKRERRELLVDELLFSTGVTTLPAQSGEGKTTLSISLGLSVATGMWGGTIIKPRPVLWVAGEGQDDLRPMFEAWMQLHPNRPEPLGGFIDGAVDLSSNTETDKLIKKLEGLPPHLIVTDALADMIGELDENSSRDVNRVYRNIWRVVRANNGSFLVPHHTGWDATREKGSTAIRAKSDIVVQITKLDIENGVIRLKHHKRRGGKKLELVFQVKLVSVPGYPQPIPIVTGIKGAAGVNLDQPYRRSANAETALVVLRNEFPHGATWAEWFEAWQRRQKDAGNAASESTFIRVLKELAGGEINESGRGLDVSKEGKGEGAIWTVNTTDVDTKSHFFDPSEPPPPSSPLEGDECGGGGSTAATPPPNHLHEGGSTKGGNGQNSVAPDEAELAAQADAKIAEEIKRMKR